VAVPDFVGVFVGVRVIEAERDRVLVLEGLPDKEGDADRDCVEVGVCEAVGEDEEVGDLEGVPVEVCVAEEV
jgi:hypothetical protein